MLLPHLLLLILLILLSPVPIIVMMVHIARLHVGVLVINRQDLILLIEIIFLTRMVQP